MAHRYCVMRLRKHGVRNNWNDGWRDERNLEGRGLRIESEKERNGAQLCRGTSGSVVALSKAHKFPNRWKMHFSNRAPGRFAQVDSFTDPKNTFLFTVSFAPLHTRTNPDSLIQRFSIRDSISSFIQFSMDQGNKNLLVSPSSSNYILQLAIEYV